MFFSFSKGHSFSFAQQSLIENQVSKLEEWSSFWKQNRLIHSKLHLKFDKFPPYAVHSTPQRTTLHSHLLSTKEKCAVVFITTNNNLVFEAKEYHGTALDSATAASGNGTHKRWQSDDIHFEIHQIFFFQFQFWSNGMNFRHLEQKWTNSTQFEIHQIFSTPIPILK